MRVDLARNRAAVAGLSHNGSNTRITSDPQSHSWPRFVADSVPGEIEDIHNWDPATLGLPEVFKLTKYTKLKG